MHHNLKQIAERLGAVLEGDLDCAITGLAGLTDAGDEDLSFLSDPRYAAAADQSRAAALLVPRDYAGAFPRPVLRVDDPYASFLTLITEFFPGHGLREPGVAASAVIHDSVTIPPSAHVGDHCVIEEGAHMGEDTVLWPGVFVGRNVRLGQGCVVYSNVNLLRDVSLGDRCIVHAGTVIGSDGFGYVHSATEHKKIPHVGSVIIGNDVEIGANVAIDRGTLGNTTIGDGVKIDNLVHIAHNVTIDRLALVVAQVGISGSSKIGAGAVLAGQAGIVGHLEIGAGAKVGAQAGVTKSVPANTVVSGYPAMEHRRAKRLNGFMRRLPELVERIKALEAKLIEAPEDADSREKKEPIT